MKNIINDHHRAKLIDAEQIKHQQAIEEFKKRPVVICSQGCVEFRAVEIFKRESAVTSASGTEEFQPVITHHCYVCGKLIPFAKQIGGIPDILISDCTMHNTSDADLTKFLANWYAGEELMHDAPTTWLPWHIKIKLYFERMFGKAS